jgi:hypothetical protein
MSDVINPHPDHHPDDHPAFALLQDYNAVSYAALADTFNATPEGLHEAMCARYNQLHQAQGYQAANHFFTRLRQVAQQTLSVSEDKALRDKAQRYAIYCRRYRQHGQLDAALTFAKEQQVSLAHLPDQLAQLKRLCNPDWWQRQLIRQQDRATEHLAICAGFVKANQQPYVSDELLARMIARHQRALAMMERMEVVNEQGDVLDMADVVKGSLANPAVRRAELMTRLKGFEHYAEQLGHVAEFYTITAPSKYHANSDKYNEATPKDTSVYLQGVWAKIRAKLDRAGIRYYGMRIAEPHADATPHYHLLLFMQPADRVPLREVLRHYALQEDGDEAGASSQRFNCKLVDKRKGSATGYVAKYISKNVDGFGMDDDTDDETGSAIHETAQRVRAWASTWGIRQFQQVGGSSVGVWRELRRLRNNEKTQDHPTLESARQAADQADWCEYLQIQNAAQTPLRKQFIKVLKQDRVDNTTGELTLNQYDEILQEVVGLWFEDESQQAPVAVVTRAHQWALRFKDKSVAEPASELNSPESDQGADGFRLSWTSENNCTQDNDEKSNKRTTDDRNTAQFTQQVLENPQISPPN